MFMGGALGHKSKLIMQNDGNLVIYDNNGKALWSSKGNLVLPPPAFEEYVSEPVYNPCPKSMPYALENPYKGAAEEGKGSWFCYKEDRINDEDHIKQENYPVCSYMGPAPTLDGKGEWGKTEKDCYPELNSDGTYIAFDNKDIKKNKLGKAPKWFRDKVGCMPTDSTEAAKKICNGYEECGGFFKYKQGTAGDKGDGTTRTCFKWKKANDKVKGSSDLVDMVGAYAGVTHIKTEPILGVETKTFDNWRKSKGGSSVEIKVSDQLPYGSKVDGWGTCLAYCKQNPECKQTVYNKRTQSCYPMNRAMDDDQDNKGGKNFDFISAHCTSTSQFKRSSVVFADDKVQLAQNEPINKIIQLIENPLNQIMNWNQARDACEDKGSKLASAAQVKRFLDKPIKGDSWTPVGDNENDWIQTGERASKGGTIKDFGRLHQNIEDVKGMNLPNAYVTADGKPKWGLENKAVSYKQKFYCTDPNIYSNEIYNQSQSENQLEVTESSKNNLPNSNNDSPSSSYMEQISRAMSMASGSGSGSDSVSDSGSGSGFGSVTGTGADAGSDSGSVFSYGSGSGTLLSNETTSGTMTNEQQSRDDSLDSSQKTPIDIKNINPLVIFKKVESKMKNKMPNFDSKIVSEVIIKQMNINPSITLENISYLPIENSQYNKIGDEYVQSSLNQINSQVSSTENISMGRTIVKIYMTKVKEEVGLISTSYNIAEHAYSLLKEKMNDALQNPNKNNMDSGSQSPVDVRLHPQIKEQRELQKNIQKQNNLKKREMIQTTSSKGYNSLFGNTDSLYKPFNSILNFFQ